MIPRIIHQSWRDAAIPECLAALAQTWRRHHPAWSYRLWTDADLAELVAARFPEFEALYHGYRSPKMRTDFGRYLVLKAHGGLFADLGCEALRPWDGVSATGRPVFAEEPAPDAAGQGANVRGFRRIVSDAVIVSPPAHPFWEHGLALMRRCRSARDPRDATGTFALTAAIDSAPSAMAPEVMPARQAWILGEADTADSPAAPLARRVARTDAPRDSPEPGFASSESEAPPPVSWRDRLREWSAHARLRAMIAAAKSLPAVAPPAGRRLLIAVPVRNAAATIDALLAAVLALDHPKREISLVFLEGDSADDTHARLAAFARKYRGQYRRIAVKRRRFGAPRYPDRNRPEVQRARRAHLARVRNLLLRGDLGDEDWVLWLDADVIALPRDLVAALLAAQARVVQPNTVIVPGGPTFDCNAWTVACPVPEEAMRPYRLHGLYQPPLGFGRLYLSDLRYRERVALDSVGGTALLVDARIHRAGVGFPETPYRGLIETEGFGAILRDQGIEIVGLPNVEARHANA